MTRVTFMGRIAAVVALLTLVSVVPAAVSQADVSPSAAQSPSPATPFPACEHPYPCGDEWPQGLDGPFGLRTVEYVQIPMDDGVLLEAWVGMPDVPADTRIPVAVHSSPYLYGCSVNVYWGFHCAGGPGDPGWWRDPPGGTGFPAVPEALSKWGAAPIRLVERGIAAVFVSVRGTGNSGGCLDLQGPREQKDQAQIVEWFATRPWSNGRVAMGGLSHPGTTPLMAAVQAPEALKTIVVGGIVSDSYLFHATPQGAKVGASHSFTAGQVTSIGVVPPFGGGAEHGTLDHLPIAPERACTAAAGYYSRDLADMATDYRDGPYYDARRLIDGFPNVTSSVLVAHGFRDDAGHAFQDSELWRTMTNAPKRLIEGQWAHTFPFGTRGRLPAEWAASTWEALVLEWLDFWLWGKGPLPEGLDSVSYQDQLGAWRESNSWPPAEARDEVLYLGGESVRTSPGGEPRSFRSLPNLFNSYRGAHLAGVPWTPWDALCPSPVTAAAGTSGLVYTTPPLESAVTVAGNPHAYLRLSSDLPGGVVAVKLIDIGPDFRCDAAGQPAGVRYLAGGGADLRFHDGTFTGHDFPVNQPTNVRIDIFDLAETILPGHRLGVEVSYGESHVEWVGQPYPSTITVRPDGGPYASHVVLPVVEGTFGGSAPTLSYPPRPFLPGS